MCGALRPPCVLARLGFRRLRRLGLVALTVGALLAVGCGADDEPASQVTTEGTTSAPSTSEPATTAAPTATTGAPRETAEPAPGGGAQAPPAEEEQPTAEPPTEEPPADSPANDTPPPPDSPADRFEQYCNENPGACG